MQEYQVKVYDERTEWFQDGMLHREGGPAIEFTDGTKVWYKRGYKHRDDGPAAVGKDGSMSWWKDGKLHREDGPAKEYANGDKEWYKNGVLHRLDGPAVEYISGKNGWYVIGQNYTEEKFHSYIGKTKKLTTAEIAEYFDTYWKNAALELTFVKNNKELCHDNIIIEWNGQKFQISPLEKT